jgi:hypothetical protein
VPNLASSALAAFSSIDRRTRLSALITAAVVAFVAHLAATEWLNASYASSGFPVPYHVAQLSFSAQRLQGWYGELLRMGTLDDYVRTQIIDFAFIATVAVLHPAVLLLIGRAFAATSRARKALLVAAALSVLAPVADAAENVVSFVMLAQPTSFASWLAWVYSSLAAFKFAMFTFAYAAALVGVVTAAWSMSRRNVRRARVV